MPEKPGVFLLQDADTLVAMQPIEYREEVHFQELIARFPELLVGDQVDPEDPRRWVLVNREQRISTGELGASSWAIDLIFLDQDAIPTLVEIKRKSDSRLRREVVGQMLDYAANCVTSWTAESLRASFETTCAIADKQADSVLADLLQSDQTEENFWTAVSTNLTARKIRLLFVADEIPVEIRRVVQFLNDQMTQTEVLAIELRHFASGELKTIVPTVYGHSQTKPGRGVNPGRRWNEATLFDKLSENVTETELKLARQLYEWMRSESGRPLIFGTGRENGSVYPSFKPSGVPINPVYLSSDGKIWIQFGSLENKPIFGNVEKRRELMQQFNAIQNVSFSDHDLSKYRSVPLKAIVADPDGGKQLLNALNWMKDQIAKS